MAKRKKDAGSQSPSSSSRSARRRLGRGLSSLISSPVPVVPENANADDYATSRKREHQGSAEGDLVPERSAAGRGVVDERDRREDTPGTALQMVSVDAIQPNRLQPRQQFDAAGLESLATSIRSAGVMQPIVLRPSADHIDGNQYELVAGERRWRAAKLAGLNRVPAVVRSIDDATAAEWALIENIQREDLNPIERAEAFRRLCDDFSLTHQEIADRVGLDRSSVTNLLRLLELDRETIDDVRAGHLTLGHGRALLALTNTTERRALARQTVRQGWSVRALERRIKSRTASDAPEGGGSPNTSPVQIHLRHLADELGRHLGTRVRIEAGRKKGSGKLVIDFYSLDEFESLLDRLGYQAT